MGEIGVNRKKMGTIVNPAELFYGELNKKVDLQGRISLPSRYKERFKGGLVLQRGYDRCINIWPPSEFGDYARQVAALPTNISKERRQRRNVFSSSFDADMDRQGRVLIPSRLREYAHIDEEVVIAGMGSYLELWSRDEWELEREAIEADSSRIAEQGENYR